MALRTIHHERMGTKERNGKFIVAIDTAPINVVMREQVNHATTYQ